MITALSLQNFKCFSALDLELAPLTLFTGFNAGGKSTTIQTLLLLEQTLRGPLSYPCLMLNGPILNLGSPVDVLNQSSDLQLLTIQVAASEQSLTWQFAVSRERLLTVSHLVIEDGVRHSRSGEELIGIRPQGGEGDRVIDAIQSIVYLGAARQVDTEVYPSAFGAGLSRGDIGPIGQYASWWLHEMGDEPLPLARRHPASLGREVVRQQVNAWLSDLFPGAEANSRPIDRTNLVRLELRSGLASDWVRPANIGFGISYAFPIIVAGLCAGEEQTVILDSPEAHLHPRAQSRVGRFLAQMAGAGGQMLIETHSDHVLNGVRIAVRDGLVKPEDTVIYFFTGTKEAQVIRLFVDKNGAISDLPGGFFDQAEHDLSDLAGWNV
jgi:predicted ATPase